MNPSSTYARDHDDQIRMIDESAVSVLRNDRQRARKLRFTEPGFEAAKWTEFVELGWLALCLAENQGGLGLGAQELCAISRRLGQELTPEPIMAAAIVLPAIPAERHAALFASQELILPAFARFDDIPAQIRNGRLYGRPMPVPFGSAATAFVVQTAEGAALVDARDAGIAASTHRAHDGSHVVSLEFNGATAQPLGAAMDIMREQATATTAAYLLGIAETALDITLEYIKERRQFDQPIGAFQALQHRAVDMLLELRLGQAAVDAAAASLVAEASPKEAAYAVSLAMARAIRACRLITREAVQFHGGIGYTDEADVGLYLRKCMAISGSLGSERFHRHRAFSLLER